MQFEYKVTTARYSAWTASVEKRDAAVQDALTPLGLQGWELVSVVPIGHYVQLYLKRAK